MTQLEQLDMHEPREKYKLSPLSTLKNLKKFWFDLSLDESDPGIDFSQMLNLEEVAIQWFPNVTQLVHLKKLRQLIVAGYMITPKCRNSIS